MHSSVSEELVSAIKDPVKRKACKIEQDDNSIHFVALRDTRNAPNTIRMHAIIFNDFL